MLLLRQLGQPMYVTPDPQSPASALFSPQEWDPALQLAQLDLDELSPILVSQVRVACVCGVEPEISLT